MFLFLLLKTKTKYHCFVFEIESVMIFFRYLVFFCFKLLHYLVSFDFFVICLFVYLFVCLFTLLVLFYIFAYRLFWDIRSVLNFCVFIVFSSLINYVLFFHFVKYWFENV